MEENPVKKTNRKSGKLIFLLASLLLFLLAGGVSMLLPDKITLSKQRIGLIEVKGVIIDASETIRQISKFRKDHSIRGIVLRIDSPGGAVAPSQEIYTEILKLKSQKKVFASMGSVAASGGYYIASAADLIVANPGTLTGSIGVIMSFANIEQLMNKIGLHPETLKSGKFKDTGSPTRPMLPEERKLLQNVIDNVYSQFVDAVAKGRKMAPDKVKELADGRIYTGQQAFDLKLVDRLGSLEDTISLLGKSVGIEGEPKVVQEKPSHGILDLLMEGSLSERIIGSIAPQFPLLQYLWTLE